MINFKNDSQEGTYITPDMAKVITPELAKEMLDTMEKNRKLSTKAVQKYLKDIILDRFGIANDLISFDEEGHLTNGQHRLTAVIKSGKSIRAYVGEVPRGTVIDIGNKRTEGASLYLSGNISKELSSTNCISLTNAYLMIKSNGSFGGGLTAIEKGDFMTQNESNIILADRIARHGNGTYRLCRKAGIASAIFGALLCGVNENKLFRFAEVANSGLPKDSTEWSANVLRNYALSGDCYRNVGGTTEQKNLASVAEQAIQDFIKGYPRKQMYKPGPHPYIKPEEGNKKYGND